MKKHGKGLGEGQWPEEAAILGLQSEYGDEGDGNNQERVEERLAHLFGSLNA